MKSKICLKNTDGHSPGDFVISTSEHREESASALWFRPLDVAIAQDKIPHLLEWARIRIGRQGGSYEALYKGVSQILTAGLRALKDSVWMLIDSARSTRLERAVIQGLAGDIGLLESLPCKGPKGSGVRSPQLFKATYKASRLYGACLVD